MAWYVSVHQNVQCCQSVVRDHVLCHKVHWSHTCYTPLILVSLLPNYHDIVSHDPTFPTCPETQRKERVQNIADHE
jgi:hypothetical protein